MPPNLREKKVVQYCGHPSKNRSNIRVKPNIRRKKKVRSLRWTSREVKTLLGVLREYGHKEISTIARFIPTRTKLEISQYLKKHEQSAMEKFRKKKRLQIQDCFDHIHPWMSFMNVHCNNKSEIHNYLVAYILPILEEYGNHPSAEFGSLNFKTAYRALFSALTMQPFPENLDHETFSMIFASLSQLHEEIRTNTDKDESFKAILQECLQRHFTSKDTAKRNQKTEEDTLMLPDVNILQVAPEDLPEFCEV